MSFGLLKHFKDHKRAIVSQSASKHFQHVILGEDLGAVLKLLETRKNFPDETVRLISNRLLSRDALIQQYDDGVTQIRSLRAVEAIYRKFHHSQISPYTKDAAFYKEGKFHDFTGRAKTMELQKGEAYFIPKGFRLKIRSLFSPEEWEHLDEILSEHYEIKMFEAIEKTQVQDLVEKKEWVLRFKDFTSMSAENLYISTSPKKFLSYLSQKEQFTPELIDVCTSVVVQAGISVTWKLDKEYYAESRTLFIPQSMTHEWGHFIVEFESFDQDKNEQLCHALFLIHEEDPQSEDLAAKIKLMKRVLERVFPDLEAHIKKEYIRVDDEMFISNVKDEAIEQLSFDYPTLKFLGQMSPLKTELLNENFLPRVLLN
ncbi:MAG TPA: hypothetical protein VNJ01_10205 [Bacteriovoracaceae bacterium]|nr:hypothetical protein [Bacteriovoracaceae bacterium]